MFSIRPTAVQSLYPQCFPCTDSRECCLYFSVFCYPPYCCIVHCENIFFRSRNIKLSFVAIITFSQIWFGGAIFQLNELWLKTCLIYSFVLAVYTAYLWPKLGRDKYIPMIISIGIMITYTSSFVSRYTGQNYVEDDCNGHLYHDRDGRPVSRPDLIDGLLYTKSGESEKHFPSSMLPKGRGCDYSRPLLKPVKPNQSSYNQTSDNR